MSEALIGGAMDFANNMYSYGKSKKSAKKSAERQLSAAMLFAQNQHQWEVGDLKAAGINPVYTATGGGGVSSSGPVGVTQAETGNSQQGAAYAQAMSAMRVGKAQEKNLEVDTGKKAAETAETLERTKNITPVEKAKARQLSAQAIKMTKETITEGGKPQNILGSKRNQEEYDKKRGYSINNDGKKIPYLW